MTESFPIVSIVSSSERKNLWNGISSENSFKKNFHSPTKFPQQQSNKKQKELLDNSSTTSTNMMASRIIRLSKRAFPHLTSSSTSLTTASSSSSTSTPLLLLSHYHTHTHTHTHTHQCCGGCHRHIRSSTSPSSTTTNQQYRSFHSQIVHLSEKNPYKVLGLDKNASKDEVKKKYKEVRRHESFLFTQSHNTIFCVPCRSFKKINTNFFFHTKKQKK